MKRFVLSMILLLFVVGIANAANYPEHQGRLVNDFTGTLDSVSKDRIEKMLREYEQKSTNEITVALIPSLDGENIDMYSVKLFEKWKIGKKGKDNGLLFLMAMKERKWRFEVGYGLEGAINDGKCGYIAREFMVPYFKKKDFGKGIEEGLTAIIKNIEESKVVVPETKQENSRPSDIVIFFIILGIVLFSILTGVILTYMSKKARKEDEDWKNAVDKDFPGHEEPTFIPPIDSSIPVMPPPVYTTHTESRKEEHHSHHDDDDNDSFRSSSSSSDSFSSGSGFDFGGGSSGGAGASGDW